DSIRMGILMNTRGLMEIVVLNIGYELGILSPTLFAMFLIMALVCTLMTNPMMDLCDRLIRR
ncbi:MAG TPA: cation/H(+) antiporter, partial [Chitinophagaceae bacterium]|nr:cation/H(+) antiporter [Chitinophagaceae bacterium]